MSDPKTIDTMLLKDLLTSVKDLQFEVTPLKSGVTRGNNLPTGTIQGCNEPGQDGQLQHGRDMSDNIILFPEKRRKENGEEFDKEATDSSMLSKAGSAFMEAAVKTKLNATARKKKLGTERTCQSQLIVNGKCSH